MAATDQTAKFFISYSRADGLLVAPIVKLLRVNRSFVYLDSDSIRPGKKWREELEAAISDANVVIVFWCCHSDASKEVEKEVSAAVERGKDVLPLLLDATELPTKLAEYQFIDFREVVGPAHHGLPTRISCSTAPAPRHGSRTIIWGTALASVVAVSIGLSWLFETSKWPNPTNSPSQAISPTPPKHYEGDPPVKAGDPVQPKDHPAKKAVKPPSPVEQPSFMSDLMFGLPGWMFVLTVLLALTALGGWLMRRRPKQRASAEAEDIQRWSKQSASGEVEVLVPEVSREIASRIEDELVSKLWRPRSE